LEKNNKKTGNLNWKKVIMATFFVVLLIMLLVWLILNSQRSSDFAQTARNSTEPAVFEEEKKDTSFTLTAIGDVLCHNTQYWDAYDKQTDTYDFSYVFDDITSYIKARRYFNRKFRN